MNSSDRRAFWRIAGDLVLVGNDNLQLAFSKQDGRWMHFEYRGSEFLANGVDLLPVDVNLDEEWCSRTNNLSFKSFHVNELSQGIELHLMYEHPLFMLDSVYFVPGSDMPLYRHMELTYIGSGRHRLRGFQYSIPNMVIGKSEECIFSAPGQTNSAKIPLSEQAIIQPSQDDLDRLFWKGLLSFGQFNTAPDIGLGLMVLFNQARELGLFSWFYSDSEPCTLFTYGHGNSLSIHYQHRVESYLEKGESIKSGTQYISVEIGHLPNAMKSFQCHWETISVIVPRDIPTWVKSAVIFETHPIIEGGIKGLKKKLPYIYELGCNTIYLCPIWESAEVTDALRESHKSVIWRLDPTWQRRNIPHRIRDFYKLDQEIGSEEDLKDLVAEAHGMGIRVLFDLVFHGVTQDSALVKEHPDWFELNLRGDMFSSHEWLPNYSWDWANPEVQEYVVNFGLHNLLEYDIDGYRVDAALAKEPNWDPRVAYRASHTAFGGLTILRKLRHEMKKLKPDAILLSEESGPILDTICDICNSDAIQRMLFDAARNRISVHDLMEWLDILTYATPREALRVWSLENHNAARKSPSPTGLRGSPMARVLFALCAFAGDVPLIWSGQELGIQEEYRKWLSIRNTNQVFQLGHTIYQGIKCNNFQVFTCFKGTTEAGVIIAANLSAEWQNIDLDLSDLLYSLRLTVPLKARWLYPIEWAERNIILHENILSFELLPFQIYAMSLEASQ